MTTPLRAFLIAVSFLLCAPHVRAQDQPAPPDAKRVLLQMAEQERSARYASAYSMFIGGAAAISAGLIADFAYDRGYGRVIWIVGAVAEVGGVVNLLVTQPFERMAGESEAWSPSQLQSEWSRRALTARKARKIGGVVGLSLGALAIGGGAAVAAGLGDMAREPKQDWTTTLIVFGGAMMGGGVTSLLVESPFEASYRVAYGSEPGETEPVKLSVAPMPGGAALSLRGSF
jgi:MFS family permease